MVATWTRCRSTGCPRSFVRYTITLKDERAGSRTLTFDAGDRVQLGGGGRQHLRPEERAEWLSQCAEAVHRVSRVLRDLLDFARGDADSLDGPRRVDAVDAVRRTVALVSPQRRFRGVEVVAELFEAPVHAAIGEQRLQQVLVNLLLNAADAAHDREGGGHVRVSVTRDGPVVRIAVEDDGAGVPAAIRGRVFDPFFTTKDPGHGTGLGLSVCYSIVAAVGGDISVDGAPEQGARFVVTLPVAGTGELEG